MYSLYTHFWRRDQQHGMCFVRARTNEENVHFCHDTRDCHAFGLASQRYTTHMVKAQAANRRNMIFGTLRGPRNGSV